ncbi:MAG TPA: oligosaccharide flippase family protein [Sphingomicrobium sp.]
MTRGLVRNTMLGSAAGAVTTIATFVSGVAIARLIGPDGTGAVAYGMWCVAVAVTIVDLGAGTVLKRFVPDLTARGDEDGARRLAGSLARSRALALLPAGLLLVLWLQLGGRDGEDGRTFADPLLAGLLVAAFAGQAMGSLYTAYLKGSQRFGLVARLSLAAAAVQVVAVGFGAWQFGVTGALGGYVAASLIAALLGSRMLLQRGPVTADLQPRIRRFALASWSAAVIGGLVWTRSEILFLEAYGGLTAVGFFAAAATLTAMATALPILLTGALLPYFSEQHSRKQRSQMQAVYSAMTLIVALIVLPGCFGMAAIAPVLVPLLFGPSFAAAVPVAMVLLIPAAAGVVGAVNPTLIYGMEKSSILLYSNLAGLAGMICLGLLVIPSFGLMGAAWSRAAVHVGVVAIETWYVSRTLGFAPPFRALAVVSAASALSGLTAYLLVLAISGPLSLLVAIPSAMLAFGLAIRVLGVLPMVDTELLRRASAQGPRGAERFIERLICFLTPPRARAQHG